MATRFRSGLDFLKQQSFVPAGKGRSRMTTEHEHALLTDAFAGELLSGPARAALAQVAGCIERGSALIVVAGREGSGKTLLLKGLEEKCKAEGMSVARISPGDPAETAPGTHANVLMIDDADRLTHALASALIGTRGIRRADTVVLTCLEGTARRFAVEADPVFVQLPPLADYEARSYLLELAMRAGRPDLFTFEALSALVDAAQGSVRLLRSAARLAVSCALPAGSTQVTKEHVKDALAKQITASEMEDPCVVPAVDKATVAEQSADSAPVFALADDGVASAEITPSEMGEASFVVPADDARAAEAPADSTPVFSLTDERVASAQIAPSEIEEPAVVSAADDARAAEAPGDSAPVLSLTDACVAFAQIAPSEIEEPSVVSGADDTCVADAPADPAAVLGLTDECVVSAQPVVPDAVAGAAAPRQLRRPRRRLLGDMPARLEPAAPRALPGKARFRRRAAILAAAAIATAATTSLLIATGAERPPAPADVASLQAPLQVRESNTAQQNAGSGAEPAPRTARADVAPALPRNSAIAPPAAAAADTPAPAPAAGRTTQQAEIAEHAARWAQAAKNRAEQASLAIEAARFAQAGRARAERATVPNAAARPAPRARDVATARDDRRALPEYRLGTDAPAAALEHRRARDFERAQAERAFDTEAHEAELERHDEALRAYDDQLRAWENRRAAYEAAEAARAFFQMLERRPSVLMREDYFEVPPPFGSRPPPYAFRR